MKNKVIALLTSPLLFNPGSISDKACTIARQDDGYAAAVDGSHAVILRFPEEWMDKPPDAAPKGFPDVEGFFIRAAGAVFQKRDNLLTPARIAVAMDKPNARSAKAKLNVVRAWEPV